MTRRRSIPVFLLGAALREFVLPALRRLADWMDPADSATPAWDPQPIAPPVVVDDYVPEYLTSDR